MLIILLTLILDLLLTSFLVALAFYALKTRYNWNIPNKVIMLILLIVFIFLGTYWLPAFSLLNATITIGNETISKFLELKPNTPIMEFFDPDWFDIVIYSLQVFIALLVLGKMNRINKNT